MTGHSQPKYSFKRVLAGTARSTLSLGLGDALTRWNELASAVTGAQFSRVHESLARVEWSDSADHLDRSWRMQSHPFPWSCTDEEGLLLYDVITANALTRGFEIATAFGYSSLYIGLALKACGGSMAMDCYVEEQKETYAYQPEDMRAAVAAVRARLPSGRLPSGLAVAKTNAEKLGLADTIRFDIGISPEDVPRVIGDGRIDFAFIDGGHFDDQPTEDFRAVAPYLDSKCAVAFHDDSAPSVARAVAEAEQTLNVSAIRFPTRHRMTIVPRNLATDRLKRLLRLIQCRHPIVHISDAVMKLRTRVARIRGRI